MSELKKIFQERAKRLADQATAKGERARLKAEEKEERQKAYESLLDQANRKRLEIDGWIAETNDKEISPNGVTLAMYALNPNVRRSIWTAEIGPKATASHWFEIIVTRYGKLRFTMPTIIRARGRRLPKFPELKPEDATRAVLNRYLSRYLSFVLEVYDAWK